MPTPLEQFEAVFPKLVEDLTEHAKQHGIPSDALKWYQDSLHHNTLGGKCNRGLSVPDTSTILLSRPLTPHEYFQSATLGWLTELLQAFFLVSDDIMDASSTRRGQPCWYLRPSVGMIAINDAFMLESSIYVLLRLHFRAGTDAGADANPARYLALLELFHDITAKTEWGQACDLLTAPEDRVDLSTFSLEKYNFIVEHKTAWYSFYLPVALALHLHDLATPGNLAQARAILVPLGEYFQVQDDYLDCFGAPETIGKVGTDIQDNKCSWLINQALQRADAGQRERLEANYGRKDKGREAEVKRVFGELGLEEVYREYEVEKVREIREMIGRVDEGEGLKREVFERFLGKIYRRQK